MPLTSYSSTVPWGSWMFPMGASTGSQMKDNECMSQESHGSVQRPELTVTYVFPPHAIV